MTEFAAVSGQTTMTAGAKGAKAPAGASPADGAFAAMFGKAADGGAADGTAVGAETPVAVVDPALIDPALLEGEGAATTDGMDPLTGKPRKPGTKTKTTAEQAETLAMPVQVALTTPVVAETPAPAEGKAKAAPTVDAAAALATGQETKISDDKAEALKALGADGKAIADMLAQAAGKDGKAAAAPTTSKADASPTSATVTLTARQGDQSAADGSGAGDGRGREQDKLSALALATSAANDDSAIAGDFDPLRDIVQSLPPVVQSQLSVGRAGLAPTASTGQMLGDKAIDMDVSGQWIDRMAREIASIAEGTGHSRFQLTPPNLGRIQVDLWRGDDKMNVRLVAETDEAARRLNEGRSALENHARIGALSLGSVSVEKASAPFDTSREQNQRQNADTNGNAQQQASAQAQGQSAQARGDSNSGPNRGGNSAVTGSEQDGDTELAARTTRASDPRVRFA